MRLGGESDEPLHHVIRTPLPWRDADKTVCGKSIAGYQPKLILTLDDALAMKRRLGQQRFALVICMTCANHTGSWVKWDDNPVARMEREVTGGGFRNVEEAIFYELRAIGILIEKHREEFDALVAEMSSGGLVSMADLRAKRAQQPRVQGRP